MRRAARRDGTEHPIVTGLRDLGYQVQVLSQPVDLLVRNPRTGRLDILEVHGGKRTGTGKRKDKQLEFLKAWEVPLVSTLEEATRALGSRIL
jgi:hypothetical protein